MCYPDPSKDRGFLVCFTSGEHHIQCMPPWGKEFWNTVNNFFLILQELKGLKEKMTQFKIWLLTQVKTDVLNPPEVLNVAAGGFSRGCTEALCRIQALHSGSLKKVGQQSGRVSWWPKEMLCPPPKENHRKTTAEIRGRCSTLQSEYTSARRPLHNQGSSSSQALLGTHTQSGECSNSRSMDLLSQNWIQMVA